MPFTAAELPKFTTHPAKFIPTVFGGHVLVYESRSHPGHRREFAFKTRFTNQSGVSSCYYRCMSCRSMKSKVPLGPDGKPPQIPCIAVKNGFIVNDPDFPEANDHFCIPPTIEESKQREANGFAKAIVKGRPRQRTRTGKPALKRQTFFGQVQPAQQLKNVFRSEKTDNIFDISAFNINESLIAASSSTLVDPASEVLNRALQMNFLQRAHNEMLVAEVKSEEDDSDGTEKANNLLASLISSEPALRSGITVSQKNSNVELSDNNVEDTDDCCSEYQTIPNASMLNSLHPPSTVSSSSSLDSSAIMPASRKRRAASEKQDFDCLVDEYIDRYVINNWDLPENNMGLLLFLSFQFHFCNIPLYFKL